MKPRLDTKLIVMVTREQHLKMTRAAKKKFVSLGEYVRRILAEEEQK
jgi:predicted HicB family RNase H-like nuclease